MLEAPHLDLERQRNVGGAMAPVLAAPRTPAYTPATLARGAAVLAATKALGSFSGPTPKQVFHATRSIISALDNSLEEQEKLFTDAVIPLDEASSKQLARVRLLRLSAFPEGTEFTRHAMDVQWGNLSAVQTAFADPNVAAAVDALGLTAAVGHLGAHIKRFGAVLGKDAGAAGTAEEKASAAWHDAFTKFAAVVMLDYEAEPKTQEELLGAYNAQLEAQRAEARAEEAARRAKAKAKAAAAEATKPAADGAATKPTAASKDEKAPGGGG